MARHRSPQGRRAHLGPPLSAIMAAAGVGGAHRSNPVSKLSSSLPARFAVTALAGGALAATSQHALAQSLPEDDDSTSLRLAAEESAGAQDAPAEAPFEASLETASAAEVVPAVAPVAPEPVVADAAMLVKAADLERAAAEAAAAEAAAAEAAAAEAAAAEAAAAEAAAAEEAKAAAAAEEEADSAVEMVTGRVTSGFGARWGSSHDGLDIAAPIGTPIRAPMAGTVIDSGPASGFGQWVRVQHNDGTITVYGHINRSHVSEGEEVASGELIAEVGNRGRSTGPHLHIEVLTPGGNKINPRPWLDERGIGY